MISHSAKYDKAIIAFMNIFSQIMSEYDTLVAFYLKSVNLTTLIEDPTIVDAIYKMSSLKKLVVKAPFKLPADYFPDEISSPRPKIVDFEDLSFFCEPQAGKILENCERISLMLSLNTGRIGFDAKEAAYNFLEVACTLQKLRVVRLYSWQVENKHPRVVDLIINII